MNQRIDGGVDKWPRRRSVLPIELFRFIDRTQDWLRSETEARAPDLQTTANTLPGETQESHEDRASWMTQAYGKPLSWLRLDLKY